jgi:hypothetical protein
MKPGDFLNTMAEKIGKKNDPRLTDFLSRADIQNMEIPDEVCNEIIGGLMSLEGAKNNTRIKAHFVAQALNGVDAELTGAIDDLGLDGGIFGDEKDTYAKLRTLKTKFRELLENKPANKGELEKERVEWQKKYNEINQKLAAEIEAHKASKVSIEEKYNNQVLGFLMQSKLKGLPYADREKSIDIQSRFAQMLVDEALTAKGAKPVNDNGHLKLKRADDPMLDYFDETGKQVTYDDFCRKVLADNKMLAVSDPKPGNTLPSVPTQIIPGTPAQPNPKVASVFAAARAGLDGATLK